MNIRPMIGEYEIPGIQRIGTVDRREVVEIPVPGLEGSYHQDLGSAPIAIRIEGTLAGDEPREDFLTEMRGAFQSGEPIDFVADITTATEIEQVLIIDLAVDETALDADTVGYALTLTQYVEPPVPAVDLGFDDLGDLDLELDLEALDLFDMLELPDLLLSLPEITDPTVPLEPILDGVKGTLDAFTETAGALQAFFGES